MVGNLSTVAVRGDHQEQAAGLRDPAWAHSTVLGPFECQFCSQVAEDQIGSDVLLGQDLYCVLDFVTYH